MSSLMDFVTASATGGDMAKPLEEALASYSAIGYKNFEVYTNGRGSSFNINKGAGYYLELGKKYNLKFTSLHLSPIKDNLEQELENAIKEAQFASELGVSVVVFKAKKRENYLRAAKPFLNAIEGLNLTPVIQFHEGGAFANLNDLVQVMTEIDDERMKILHEVGSFHAAEIPWKTVCNVFGHRIALVHIKDMIGRKCVPYGTGEVDIPALVNHMRGLGYQGYYVVEIDPSDKENTTRYICEAYDYLKTHCDK